MNPYESVLSCFLLACKILKSSVSEIEDMPLALLLDLINVYDKINSNDEQAVFIDDVL